jgi:phasin family protein
MLHCSISTLEAGAVMGKSKGKNKGAKASPVKPQGKADVAIAPASKAETAPPKAVHPALRTPEATPPPVQPVAAPQAASAAPKAPATQPAVATIAPKIEKGSPMTEQFQQIAQMFNPKGFEDYMGQAKEQVEKAQAQTTKAVADMAAFSKENVDAFVVASTLYAKGFENVGKAWYALTQETVEASAAVAKALLGAKTLKEAVDLQTDFAKTTFDKYVAESTKLSEMSIKVANEAIQPINARVNVAVEKLLKPANAA